ncbi:hypothetical protein [Mesorhizobium sp. YR577]|uniref:hypothetical protein n=1 Tax=Mesorhizobium sp. YR577 TaxID=1884373 RepID=UPI001587C9DC|nr:hypothetical protein [Mesorhizobium sp. YR577]
MSILQLAAKPPIKAALVKKSRRFMVVKFDIVFPFVVGFDRCGFLSAWGSRHRTVGDDVPVSRSIKEQFFAMLIADLATPGSAGLMTPARLLVALKTTSLMQVKAANATL